MKGHQTLSIDFDNFMEIDETIHVNVVCRYLEDLEGKSFDLNKFEKTLWDQIRDYIKSNWDMIEMQDEKAKIDICLQLWFDKYNQFYSKEFDTLILEVYTG